MSQPCMRLYCHHWSLNSWNTSVQPDSDPGSLFLVTFLQTSCCVVTCSLSVKLYHSIVFSSKLSSYGSQKQADRWEWDADNMQKSWTWRRFRLLTWFVSSDTISKKKKKKKIVCESRAAVCVSWNIPQICFKTGRRFDRTPSLNSPPWQSVWQTWQSCQAHQNKHTWVREWEHLGGGVAWRISEPACLSICNVK